MLLCFNFVPRGRILIATDIKSLYLLDSPYIIYGTHSPHFLTRALNYEYVSKEALILNVLGTIVFLPNILIVLRYIPPNELFSFAFPLNFNLY